ncbi:MAG: phosphatidylserine decarboxylase family protein [Calditrichaeota bacterium]|nr:MAG: phosphatidylserine decarboxylase family protein [Calditrichota bacterium]
MIAKEGIIFIIIGLVLTVGFLLPALKYDSKVLVSFSVLFAVLTIFTSFFFRDPERTFQHQERILVSPADGKVIGIDTLDFHEFIGGPAKKISIFLNVFDVHVNRIPADGKIDYVKYNPGKFFAAFEDKASELNEQTEIGMTDKSGNKLVFKQIAGLIARRIVCKISEGDSVTAGDRFGLIRFGSRTELFVPIQSDISIKVGQRVVGAETIIGFLPNKILDDVQKPKEGSENVES